MLVYHASEKAVEVTDIVLPGPRESCDFGRGFYVAANKHTAEEWVREEATPMINVFEFARDENVLHLTGSDWVHVVVGFRTKKYKVKFKSHIIAGTIADDRMDIALPLFMRGEIGDIRLLKCLDLCKLGEQYCFRQSVDGLAHVKSYQLKGQELENARKRNYSRKRDMESELRQIRRQPISGELYVEDYIARGDYIEP